ncbi:MAG TPA: EboA domain-containing protein [Fodinibius sp.]|nr:EboA domain-containing protein [Fodinibius sp.]
MTAIQSDIDIQELQKTISHWLQARLDTDAVQWLKEQDEQLSGEGEDWVFFTSFSAAPRHTTKDALELAGKEKAEAANIRTGWQPEYWSVDQLARLYLVLSIAKREKEAFLSLLDKTFVSSDMSEGVALYQMLPVLPYPGALKKRAAEGIRSNISAVFDAVALRNPYPTDYMGEDGWNQVVLKALFVGSPLYLIQGIDRRSNKKLASMLRDYAHERWAAGRSVSPELWRPVGPFAEDEFIDDLGRVLDNANKNKQYAALLALSESPSPQAKALTGQHQPLLREIGEQDITWDTIGREEHR